MTFIRSGISSLHQSDSSCLRRVRFEYDNPQPPGAAAVKGNLAHEIIERYTREQAEHPNVTPASVVREVLALHRRDADVTEDVIEDVVSIMASAFGERSELNFRLGAGTTVPEWRWALDENFAPVPPCEACSGSGEHRYMSSDGTPAHEGCECVVAGHLGWSALPAYEGAIDRLVFGARVDVYDWKSTLIAESSAEQEGDRQARWYMRAIKSWFPEAREATWHKAFLRRGFAARHTFKFNEPWVDATTARMRAARDRRLRAIETDSWPETPGPSCLYCPLYWNACVAMKKRRETGVDPGEPIADQANAYVALNWGVGQLRNRLKAYVDETQAPIDLENDDGEALGLKPVAGARMAVSYEVAMERLGRLLPPDWDADRRAAWFADYFRYVTKAGLPARVKAAATELLGRKTALGLLFSETEPWLLESTDFEFSVHVPERVAPSRALTPEEVDALIDRAFGG